MKIEFDNGNAATILAVHDDIALSSQFTSGIPVLIDMAMDSSGSFIYILVNNGKLYMYIIQELS